MQPGFPSPYAAPGAPAAPYETGKPAVVTWARVYAIAFAFMYLVATAGGALILLAASEMHDDKSVQAMIEGVVMVVLSPALMVLSIVAAAAPRKKWGWVLNVILMGLGSTSCLCMPASIPLVIFWLKPETKRWFGMS